MNNHIKQHAHQNNLNTVGDLDINVRNAQRGIAEGVDDIKQRVCIGQVAPEGWEHGDGVEDAGKIG